MAHAWSSSKGANKGSSTAPGQGWSSWDGGWSSSSWHADRSLAATAPYLASDFAQGRRAKSKPAADANFDSTRGGWHDDGAEAATGADEPVFIPDQWQSGEWNQGADPNWDTTQRLLQSWHDASPVAATAAESATGSADAWANWNPDGGDLNLHPFYSYSKPSQKRSSNQQKANVNIGRAANKRLIIAIRDCCDFRSFDYQQWLTENWDWEIYQALQAKKPPKKPGEKRPSLPMSLPYFLQVRRGFDAAISRLRSRWAVNTDDWSQEPELELIGVHRLGQKMAFCEFLANLQTLPHVTADVDCSLPPTVADTAAVQLEEQTIKTACAELEILKVYETVEASLGPFSCCPSTFEGAQEVAKHGSQLPAAAAKAADPGSHADNWGDWKSAAVAFADDAVAGKGGPGFIEGVGTVRHEMRKEREWTFAENIDPCMACLRYLSAQIMAALGKPEVKVEVSQFGSCVYLVDMAKSDADLLVVLPRSACSMKEYLTHLVELMRSPEGKAFGWTRVSAVYAATTQRKTIQPRFRGVEFDVAVCFEDPENHLQTVSAHHLRDALAARAQVQGAVLLAGIKLFKVFAWSAKLYCRHKEALYAKFKSISLVMWAAAVLKGVDIPVADTAAGEDKLVAWIVSFLISAFQNFPWDTFAVQLGAAGSLTLHRRDRYEYNVAAAGAVVWMELLQTNSAARTEPDSVKAAQLSCRDYLLGNNDDLQGFHPTDTGFIFAQGVRVWGGSA